MTDASSGPKNADQVFCSQSLIPDVRPGVGQDAVLDLHPEEVVLSGAEEEDQEPSEQDLQIRRTVTQVRYSAT